ncbi:MFS transporter [Algicola sagamiensis]|uniref:MFS transporter n=1 Tax=Algicola sagamiensis TaxID=163869 RepID=UPI0003690457|nr:MFS transporter [Algicola sagamiensis]
MLSADQRQFWMVSSVYFFFFSVLGVVSPYLSIFLSGEGFSSEDIGILLGVATLMRVIGPSLWAQIADKKGQLHRLIQIGGMLAVISFGFIFFFKDFWPLLIILALVNLFWTAILPQMEVISLGITQGTDRNYSQIRLWGSLGFIVAVLLAGVWLEWFGSHRLPELIMLLMICLILNAFFLRSSPVTPQSTSKKNSLIKRMCTTPFIIFFCYAFCLQLSTAPFNSFFGLLLTEHLNFSGYWVGALITVGVFAEIVAFLYASRFFSLWSVKSILIVCVFFTILRWCILGFVPHIIPLLVFSQLIHALSFAMTHAAAIQFIHDYFEPHQLSRAQAFYAGLVYSGAGAIGAYLAGMTWQNGAGALWTYQWAALVALVSLLFVLMMSKEQPEPDSTHKGFQDEAQ